MKLHFGNKLLPASLAFAISVTYGDKAMGQNSQPVPLAVPLTAQQFMSDAAMAGMVEIHVSQTALEKSTNADVRSFADRMVKDHSAANQKLQKIAQEDGLDFPPTNTFSPGDPNWSNPMVTKPESIKGAQLLITTNASEYAGYRAIKELDSLNGAAFDQAYWNSITADHALVINEFELAAKNLSDPKLKKFAQKMLPTLRTHSKIAAEHKYDAIHDPMHTNQPAVTTFMTPP
ncbi:MAG TPA: DUF4142 domain-containing protein [Verrucomicrobiae bacterium]|nr:DUF4142 domain-containing protein [Verrucomicrobiae bacterium]